MLSAPPHQIRNTPAHRTRRLRVLSQSRQPFHEQLEVIQTTLRFKAPRAVNERRDRKDDYAFHNHARRLLDNRDQPLDLTVYKKDSTGAGMTSGLSCRRVYPRANKIPLALSAPSATGDSQRERRARAADAARV